MEKQQFKTSDLALVLGVIALMASMVAIILGKSDSQSPSERAVRMAENISSQLLSLSPEKIQNQNVNRSELRPPASVSSEKKLLPFGSEGKIGQDPWGNPFRYRFIEKSEGQWSHLVLVSLGPDAALAKGSLAEWTFDQLEARVSSRSVSFQNGDDVIVIHRLSEHNSKL